MFNLTYDSPCEIQGTIRVNQPIYSLGPVTDVDGKRWDVRVILGSLVQACPLSELHPYYTDTSGTDPSCSGLIQQSWKPYRVEVVES